MTTLSQEEVTTSQESSALSRGAIAGIVITTTFVTIFLLAMVAVVSISVYNTRLKR